MVLCLPLLNMLMISMVCSCCACGVVPSGLKGECEEEHTLLAENASCRHAFCIHGFAAQLDMSVDLWILVL